MESFLPFLKMFATPLGSLVNKTLASGAAAVVATSVAHGNPIGDITPMVSILTLAASYAISGLAATQGVKIAVINGDDSNGVKVVSDEVPAPAVNSTRR